MGVGVAAAVGRRRRRRAGRGRGRARADPRAGARRGTRGRGRARRAGRPRSGRPPAAATGWPGRRIRCWSRWRSGPRPPPAPRPRSRSPRRVAASTSERAPGRLDAARCSWAQPKFGLRVMPGRHAAGTVARVTAAEADAAPRPPAASGRRPGSPLVRRPRPRPALASSGHLGVGGDGQRVHAAADPGRAGPRTVGRLAGSLADSGGAGGRARRRGGAGLGPARLPAPRAAAAPGCRGDHRAVRRAGAAATWSPSAACRASAPTPRRRSPASRTGGARSCWTPTSVG